MIRNPKRYPNMYHISDRLPVTPHKAQNVSQISIDIRSYVEISAIPCNTPRVLVWPRNHYMLKLCHGLKNLHRFILKRYTRLSRRRPGRKLCFFGSTRYRPQTRTQCHSQILRYMAAILAQVFSPATRSQYQNMGNKITIPMQLLRCPKTTALVRRNSTGSLSVTTGKVVLFFPDFSDPYFYFVLNLI